MFPVDMEMLLENGELVRQRWDGVDRWVKLEFTRASRPRAVEIDHGRRIPLDASFADNSWSAAMHPQPFAKWSSNLLFWMQMVLP